MALVQSQQFTDKKTPRKQRGFLMLSGLCAKSVLWGIGKSTESTAGTSAPVTTIFVGHFLPPLRLPETLPLDSERNPIPPQGRNPLLAKEHQVTPEDKIPQAFWNALSQSCAEFG
jgi:hypothetical protein